MARDIEEFLRRAAERRQQQKGGGQKPPPRPQPPRQQPQQRQPPRRQQPVEPEIIEVVPAREVRQKPQSRLKPRKKPNLRKESVAEHVKSHIDTSRIADHAEHLGERITKVHEKVESRIQKRLDHDITVIDDTPSVTDKPPVEIFGARSTASADGLREMLQDPKSIGQAILLAEILKRPDFD